MLPVLLAGKHASWDVCGTMFLGGVTALGYFLMEVVIWHGSTLY